MASLRGLALTILLSAAPWLAEAERQSSWQYGNLLASGRFSGISFDGEGPPMPTGPPVGSAHCDCFLYVCRPARLHALGL
jgi:hypothetical protein